MVRDFVYNPDDIAAGKNELTKLATDKKKQFGPLVRWLKVNFSECYIAWVHVKVNAVLNANDSNLLISNSLRMLFI